MTNKLTDKKIFGLLVALLVIALTFLVLTKLSSALIIKDVSSETILSNQEGKVTINIENDLDSDIEYVSVSLDLTNAPVTSVGSSEDSVDEISDGDNEQFVFLLRANANAKPGDYNIPFTVTYKNLTLPKKGTIGIQIRAKSDVDFTANLDNPVVGERSKLNIKIVNKGLGDVKFASLKISSSGYTMFSEDKFYIGSINSDDFESVSFDVLLNSEQPVLTGILSYEDIDGKKFSKEVLLPLTVYSQQKAIELGIKKKSNAGIYTIIIVVLLIIWFIWRAIKKRKRLQRSMQNSNGR